jgi:hypothetical protein
MLARRKGGLFPLRFCILQFHSNFFKSSINIHIKSYFLNSGKMPIPMQHLWSYEIIILKRVGVHGMKHLETVYKKNQPAFISICLATKNIIATISHVFNILFITVFSNLRKKSQENGSYRHYSIFHYSLPTSYYHSNYLLGNFRGHISVYNVVQKNVSL